MADAVTVDSLKICYKDIQQFSIKRNLLKMNERHTETFEAVRGISFSVKEGEIFGIVGRNGSGKSTLLKAIAGIFTPDGGSIDLHGHTVSLLSLGVGFNGMLSGRRNIELSGLLLGFTKDQIAEHMNQITGFAELGDFIDRPVRTYSSGMYSKLAFSITAFLETDIMLVDEVLSVGDEAFKKKSYQKMKEIISNDKRTVIIVSHSLQSLQELCGRAMWIENGIIRQIGIPRDVIAGYKKASAS